MAHNADYVNIIEPASRCNMGIIGIAVKVTFGFNHDQQ